MRTNALRVAIAAPFLLSASAPIREQAVEHISVARRLWFGVCIGACPNYDVTVWDDGRVVAVRHMFEEQDQVERFRVSRAEVAAFRGRLRRYRPASDALVPAFCEHHLPPDQAPLLLKVTEIEIRWAGAHPVRLVACDTEENARLSEDLRRALWSVHLYLNAYRRDRGD